MRKALIGFLITATALTPLASAAAERPDWGNRQQARQEQRAELQQGRAERTQDRAQRQQFRAQQPQFQAQRQRVDTPQRSFARTERGRPVFANPTPAQFREQRRYDRQDYRAQRPTRQRVAVNNIVTQQPRQWNGSRSGSNWDHNRSTNWDGNRSGDRYHNGSGYNHGSNWDHNRGGSSRNYNWNRNWRNDNRYDWQRYRSANRYRYHLPRYYSPYRGYGYSRFSIGFFLEPLFYSSRYWIADPWYYRLPPAYPGTRWVRYYDDALLVDVYSGEVIDVIYSFFW